jgi:SnoaL-like domain
VEADDYFAIQKLIFSYPYHLDRGEIDAMAALFAHAAVHFPNQPPVRSDAAAVARAFREFLRIYPDGTPRTRHVTANLIIEPEGEGFAKATSCVMVFQQTPELPLQPIIGGDYADRFQKVGGAWRFIERRIANDQFGNLSAHGKYDFRPG